MKPHARTQVRLKRPRKPKPVMPSKPEEVFRAMFRVADRKLAVQPTKSKR